MSVPKQSVKASEHINARASPACDAQISRLPSVKNGQGLPSHRRARLKKLAKVSLRVGTLNVRTMTGRGREVADLMSKRKIQRYCAYKKPDGKETKQKNLEMVVNYFIVVQMAGEGMALE
ncbi:hypothetical protein M8J77_000625 [Diaphorina citri]|nr:hypothetical protein M8J77_000625 [Diaphorina citri]